MAKMKIDKRKKYILVLDVETCGAINHPLCYDIGYAVADKRGTIIFKRHYIVNEIFNGCADLMQTCFYHWKIPRYRQMVQQGEIRVANFMHIMYEIREVMKRLKIKRVAAYNCNFDRKALACTLNFLTDGMEHYFFPKGTEFMCIWHMACQVICRKKSYFRFARRYDYVSEAGNVKTNAETVFRYLSGDLGFVEEHMGLQDVEIETQIMAYCFRQKKKMDKGIKCNCWQIPQKEFKAFCENGE